MVTIHIAQSIAAVVALAGVLMLVTWLATRGMLAHIGRLETQLADAHAAMDALRPRKVSTLIDYGAPDWVALEWEKTMCRGDTMVLDVALDFDDTHMPAGQYRFWLVAEPVEQLAEEG